MRIARQQDALLLRVFATHNPFDSEIDRSMSMTSGLSSSPIRTASSAWEVSPQTSHSGASRCSNDLMASRTASESSASRRRCIAIYTRTPRQEVSFPHSRQYSLSHSMLVRDARQKAKDL